MIALMRRSTIRVGSEFSVCQLLFLCQGVVCLQGATPAVSSVSTCRCVESNISSFSHEQASAVPIQAAVFESVLYPPGLPEPIQSDDWFTSSSVSVAQQQRHLSLSGITIGYQVAAAMRYRSSSSNF